MQLPLGYRPNIIWIKLDDPRVPETFDAQCMPYLRSIWSQLLFYKNAVVGTARCAPNRSLSYSGLHSLVNGCIDNDTAALVDYRNSWMRALRAAGYRTAQFGKHMNKWGDVGGWGSQYDLPWGFGHFQGSWGDPAYLDYDVCHNGQITEYGSSDADYSTDVEAASIVAAIGTVKPPFAFYCGSKVSHVPCIPATRHATAPITITRTANFNPEYNKRQPAWYYDKFGTQQKTPAEIAEFNSDMVTALRCALALDEMVEDIVAALSARNLLKSTLIAIDVDNGYAGGKHGNDGKGVLFEECINAHTLIRLPGATPAYAGTRPQIISAVDTAETLCHLAGTHMPYRGHGMSFVPTFASANAPHRREALVFALEDNAPAVEGVRGYGYTAGRGRDSGHAHGQSWCWPDVGQQLTSVPMTADQGVTLDRLMAGL